jgi:hypothetical protein
MTNRDIGQTHYTLLQVEPTASPQDIRRAYRDLSKLYHPDTTTLSSDVAVDKFKALNEAYATLSNPERRLAYDYSIGVSRVAVIQAPEYINRPASERSRYESSSAYLDPTDRPLSPGELFALFILGITFVGCLVLVCAIGWTKGDIVIHPLRQEAVMLEPSASASEAAGSRPVQTFVEEEARSPEIAPMNRSNVPQVPLPSDDLSSNMI